MIRIGISGWTYAGWRGVFYPEELTQKKELEYSSRQFPSIEINGTHYSLQRPSTFRKWHDETPEDFVFSVKGSRYISHLKRLKDIEVPLANFFAQGVLCLGEKLGPLLWQLPPNFKFDAGKLEAFFRLLPRSTAEAKRLMRRASLEGGSASGAARGLALRHCLEVRHESFVTPEFFELLREHRIAFVFADTAGKWPYAEDLTSDFVYIRLHGDKKLYESGYGRAALQGWAKRIRRWAAGGQPRDAKLVSPRKRAGRHRRDVFVYFDNDAKVKAPGDARMLRKLVGS